MEYYGTLSCSELNASISSVATIFGPTRKQLVWAPGQGVTATTSSWRAPCEPLQPRGPSAVAGPAGPSLRHWLVYTMHIYTLLYTIHTQNRTQFLHKTAELMNNKRNRNHFKLNNLRQRLTYEMRTYS